VGESRSVCEQWKIDVNDRFRRLVDLLLGLSTAGLVLPALFLREYLGIPEADPSSFTLTATPIYPSVHFFSPSF
jgi:hypothetical protein